MILVSGWWTRREQPLRNNLWYSANGIALILGSLIAWGLGHIQNGALYVYQYIFLGRSDVVITQNPSACFHAFSSINVIPSRNSYG